MVRAVNSGYFVGFKYMSTLVLTWPTDTLTLYCGGTAYNSLVMSRLHTVQQFVDFASV